MKVVKNDSFQSFSVYFSTDKGYQERWLKPGESIVVPAHYITEQIKTMTARRLLKIESYV